MHMADALISPTVGATLWSISGALIAYCARKVQQSMRDNLVPMMGVLGAFVFAAQMINFAIPGTGSSGHLGGGLLLTALLGPHAAFLVIASVLTVQACFFADGGLLALGCNIFNLGFFPAFIAYPLVYRVVTDQQPGSPRAGLAAMAAAIVGLQLGALGVVLETSASGIAGLPVRSFLLLMLPIHLAIGIVEGLATAAVVGFVTRTRPDALHGTAAAPTAGSLRGLCVRLLVAALLVGGLGSWFASSHPDGLEWAISRVSGAGELPPAGSKVHEELAGLQGRTALLPDYGFKSAASEDPEAPAAPASWPAAAAGTSVSGIVGGLVTLALAGLLGLALKARAAPQAP